MAFSSVPISVYLSAAVSGGILAAAQGPAQRGIGGVQPAVLCLGRAERRGHPAGAGGYHLAGRPAAGKTTPQKAAAYPFNSSSPGGAGGVQVRRLRGPQHQCAGAGSAAGVRPGPAAGHQLLRFYGHRISGGCVLRQGRRCLQSLPFFCVPRLLRPRPLRPHCAV